MATRVEGGPKTWSMRRDEEGYREYNIVYQVIGETTDGPATVLNTLGLPVPGSAWIIDNDVDLWVWCRAVTEVTPVISDGDPNTHWHVSFIFSNKPPDFKRQRCQDVPIEDPILEPAKISGTFHKYTLEASYDRFGNPILNSAHEPIRGPVVEFDDSRPTVRIEQNIPALNWAALVAMRDTVNDAPLWGLPRRCIKLSNISWERKFYGQCYLYYTRILEFDINHETWDRNVMDEGNKMLNGHWDPVTGDYVVDDIAEGVPANHLNPTHFIRATDRHGNFTRIFLNGVGMPARVRTPSTSDVLYMCLEDGTTETGLEDSSVWLPLVSIVIERDFEEGLNIGDAYSALDLDQFDDDTDYPVGFVVGHQGTPYIAISANGPPFAHDPSDATLWAPLGNPVVFQGEWDEDDTYNAGEFVIDAGGETGTASFVIEKYKESNFLLLGIPTIF